MTAPNPGQHRAELSPETGPINISFEDARDKVNIPGTDFFSDLLAKTSLRYWQRPRDLDIINNLECHLITARLTEADRNWHEQRGQFCLDVLGLIKDEFMIVAAEPDSAEFQESINNISNQFKDSVDEAISQLRYEIEATNNDPDDSFLTNRGFSFKGETNARIGLNLNASELTLAHHSNDLIRADLRNQPVDLSTTVYINSTNETQVPLFRNLIKTLPHQGFPTTIQMIHRGAETKERLYRDGYCRRLDGITVYSPQRNADQSLEAINQAWVQSGAVAAGPPPLLTTEIGAGIGLASTDGIRSADISFSRHRAGLILQAVRAFLNDTDPNIIKSYNESPNGQTWREFIGQPANLKPLEIKIADIASQQGLSQSNLSFGRSPIRTA